MKLLFNPTGSSKKPGVLIPIPQYPLYSATVAEFNMHQVSKYVMILLLLLLGFINSLFCLNDNPKFVIIIDGIFFG